MDKGNVVVRVLSGEGAEVPVATIRDIDAFMGAVLPAEVWQRVNAGEMAEIELLAVPISVPKDVPEEDYALLHDTARQHAQSIAGLQIGMFFDITLHYRVGDEEWVPVHETAGDIMLDITIPSDVPRDDTTHYMLHAHGGETALLHDLHEDADIIAIETNLFSTYALAFTAQDDVCPLCGFCPHPLGICIFIWLLIIAAIVVVIIIVYKNCSEIHGLALIIGYPIV
ncbi:MAG TPA: hypothetical protein DEB31_07955 [Clostridiales bacterium]|nr:hypothetical protein [Clostridiales bacterium]